jgi:hypothetical protein
MAKTLTFSTDPHDPPFWPLGLTFKEQLQRLEQLAPDRAQAVRFFLEHPQSRKMKAALTVLLEMALRDEFWRISGEAQ